MIRAFTLLNLIIAIGLLNTSCLKRSSSITVKLVNPLLNAPEENMECLLIEAKKNVFNKTKTFSIIKSRACDKNGNVDFGQTTLNMKNGYDYYLAGSSAFKNKFNILESEINKLKPIDKAFKSFHLIFDKGKLLKFNIFINNLDNNGFNNDTTNKIVFKLFRNFDQVEGFNDELNGSKELEFEFVLTYQIFQNIGCCSNSFDLISESLLDHSLLPGKYRMEITKFKQGFVSKSTDLITIPSLFDPYNYEYSFF